MKRLGLSIIFLLLMSVAAFSGSLPQVSVRSMWAAEGESEPRVACTIESINEKVGLWLTAAHCVIDNAKLSVLDSEVLVPLAPVLVDKTDDVAVLLADLHVPALKLAEVSPSAGDPIHMIGHPLGLLVAQFFEGKISSLKVDIEGRGVKMAFQMPACGGNSGSAVLNAQNEIVSVLQLGAGQPCSSFSMGIPYDKLVELIGRFF